MGKAGRSKRRKRKYRKHIKNYCERCGFVATHPCQIDAHHRDRNSSNNKAENIISLCCCCHRLESVGLLEDKFFKQTDNPNQE